MAHKVKSKGTVLVTGGAKRIGKAICQRLAQEGYDIALHYNSSSTNAEKVAKDIRSSKIRCETFCCDLSQESQVINLIREVRKKFPDFNTLINNASIFEKSNLKTASALSFNKHFDINFKAPFLLTQSFAKLCKRGNVINILDTHITHSKTAHFTYLLSKKALAELTQMSAVELAPDIRVNGVAPGLTLAPVGQKYNYLNRLAKHVPLKKKGSPIDIANTILFLLKNTNITGQIIFNDGGEHLLSDKW